MSNSARRLLVGAGGQHARNARDGSILAKLRGEHRSHMVTCGYATKVDVEQVSHLLQSGTHLFVLLVTGEALDWSMLEKAACLHETSPYGVVVLTKDPDVWRRLAAYEHMSFVIDMSGEQCPDREGLFARLLCDDRFTFVDTTDRDAAWQQSVRFLETYAMG